MSRKRVAVEFNNSIKKSTLLSKTLELCRHRPVTCTYGVIAHETGLPLDWIQNLMAGRIKDPTVSRIETLYCFLSKSELFPKETETA